jgi:hypothetical protein
MIFLNKFNNPRTAACGVFNGFYISFTVYFSELYSEVPPCEIPGRN